MQKHNTCEGHLHNATPSFNIEYQRRWTLSLILLLLKQIFSTLFIRIMTSADKGS